VPAWNFQNGSMEEALSFQGLCDEGKQRGNFSALEEPVVGVALAVLEESMLMVVSTSELSLALPVLLLEVSLTEQPQRSLAEVAVSEILLVYTDRSKR